MGKYLVVRSSLRKAEFRGQVVVIIDPQIGDEMRTGGGWRSLCV